MTTDIRAFAIDLAERAAFTFAQAFVAALIGAQVTSHVTSWAELAQVGYSAALAGGAAVLALLKGVIGGVRTGTASVSKTVAAAAGQVEQVIQASAAPIAPAPAPAAVVDVEAMPDPQPVAPTVAPPAPTA